MIKNLSAQCENNLLSIKNVSRETIFILNNFVALVLLWNKKINLISSHTEVDIWYRHILDCAQLINYIDNCSDIITDFGGGGGFPSIVVSILGIKEIHIIESNRKKCIFLREAAKLSPNKIYIYNNRIENVNYNWHTDIVISRALGNINKLLFYSKMINNSMVKCLFLKGESIEKELEEARILWNFDYKLYKTISSEKGWIIYITNIEEKYV